MKKTITTLFIAAVSICGVNAQAVRTAAKAANGTKITPSVSTQTINSDSRAIGDTIFLFDGNVFSWAEGAVDEATFASENLNLDANVINPAIAAGFNAEDGYTFYYALDTTIVGQDTVITSNEVITPEDTIINGTDTTIIPADTVIVNDTSYVDETTVDSLFYFGAFSWFTTVATADDWFIFGPVTIPASGAKIKWQHRMPDNDFRDGYEVFVGSSMFPDEFTDKVFDLPDNSPLSNGDTVFTPQEAWVPFIYNGQPATFAFHHDARDMFILYLDEIAIVEDENLSVNKLNDLRIVALYPNPSNEVMNISYALNNTENVQINVMDITGKVISTINEGTKAAGNQVAKINTSDFANGIYLVNFMINGQSYVQKFTVAH